MAFNSGSCPIVVAHYSGICTTEVGHYSGICIATIVGPVPLQWGFYYHYSGSTAVAMDLLQWKWIHYSGIGTIAVVLEFVLWHRHLTNGNGI